MALTLTFRLDIFVKWSGQADGNHDTIGLDGGGYAYIGDYGTSLSGVISDSEGVGEHLSPNNGSWNPIIGTNASITQLASGDLAVAAEAAGSIVVQLFDRTDGADLTTSIDLGLTNRSNPDVAGVSNGRFFIACENTVAAGNGNIEILIRDDTGGYVDAFEIAGGSENDSKPCIAALDGEGAAVAWTRTKANGNTEIWYAVLDNNGNYVKPPTLLDDFGSTNRNVSVAAMDGGGFAVAYEDNGWQTGTIDITVATLAADGKFDDWFNAGGASDDEQPALTRFSNGFLGLICGDNSTARTEQVIRLLDPTAGYVLAKTIISNNQGGPYDDSLGGTIADIGDGRLVGVYERALFGNSLGNQTLVQAVRITQGDSKANVITTDEFSAVMYGRGGDDVLTGGINRDWLFGGLGRDKLATGDSKDILQGGLGSDVQTGGNDKDRFVYQEMDDSAAGATRDIILDFTVWPSADQDFFDRIDLSRIDANEVTVDDDAFTFIGASPFSGSGEIGAYQLRSNTIIAIDIDGGGIDMEIVLRNFDVTLLSADDFVL